MLGLVGDKQVAAAGARSRCALLALLMLQSWLGLAFVRVKATENACDAEARALTPRMPHLAAGVPAPPVLALLAPL